MATQESVYADVKRAELQRWGEWRDELFQLRKRVEIVADEIDGMEVHQAGDPERRSVEGAAEAVDALLPLVEQLAEHGYPEEHAAEMLRMAADRIEGSS